MNEELIHFAFAVNHAGHFEAKHFGDADKYLIYKWDINELFFLKEIINPFKTLDEEQEHGSKKKGEAIIDLLKNEGVNVLVAKQFGKNIQMVNRHFVSVIVYSESPDEVTPLLKKHMKWIDDELSHNPKEFKLFTLKNGALKTIIKKKE